MNKLRFIKRVIYELRKSYGLPIDYYRRADATVNETTGAQSFTETKYSIKRAIRLPRKQIKWPVNTGTYDAYHRKIIILAGDLEIEPSINSDYITFDSKNWEIVQVFELDYNQGYLLVVKAFE